MENHSHGSSTADIASEEHQYAEVEQFVWICLHSLSYCGSGHRVNSEMGEHGCQRKFVALNACFQRSYV